MRSILRSPALLIPLAAVGCSGLAGSRSAFSPQIRTIASVGDKPLPVVAGAPGESVTATQVDPPGRTREEGRVSGRVVDARGKPVPNARVRVAIGGASGGKAIRASTDDSGGFTLHGLRPGTPYTLIAEADDPHGLITGRSSVEAPDNQVRIRLRDLEDPPASGSSPRISSASDVREGEPDDDPGQEDARPRRVNEEDLPPEPEASAPEPADREQARDQRPLPQLAAPEQGSRWRRGTPASDSSAPADPLASRSSTREEEPPAPKAALDPIDPPSREEPADPPARMIPDAIPIEEDIPNPLPPAIEPSQAQSVASPAETGPVEPARPTPEPEPEPGPEPQFGAEPDPALPAAEPEATNVEPARAEEAGGRAIEAEPATQTGPTASEPEPGPGLAAPDREADSTAPASGFDELPTSEEAAPEPQAATAPDPRAVLASRASFAESPFGPPSEEPTADLGAMPAKRPNWGDVAAQYTELADADLEPTASASPAPEPTPPTARERTRLALNGKAADSAKSFCRYDPKRRQLVDFRLPDLQGKPVRFQDLDADYILIDFWGTWCSYCVKSIPHLVELQKQLGPDRLKVVGVAYEEGPFADRAANVAEMAQKLGINYTLLLGGLDGPCPLQAQLHVQSYPTMILVDRYGRVLWRDSGATPTTLARLDRVLASATNGDFVRR